MKVHVTFLKQDGGGPPNRIVMLLTESITLQL